MTLMETVDYVEMHFNNGEVRMFEGRDCTITKTKTEDESSEIEYIEIVAMVRKVPKHA
jgi:hypothetical protein